MEYRKDLIHRFKQCLDDMQYELLTNFVLNDGDIYVNPFHDYYSMKRDMKKLSPTLGKILSFFLLGDPVEIRVLEEKFDSEILDYLYETEIMNRDETECWLNSYILVPYCNCYFIVSNVHYYPTCQNPDPAPYIGFDSYWLSKTIVNRMHGDVLDLCTGSGIQAILSAKCAKKVVAVDINPEALKISRFNAYLNDVDDVLEYREGNLYSVIKEDETFDYILSNPPFIPIPKGIKFPICGDGGEDGKEIVRVIMNGYSKYLKENGTGIMIGQALGNSEKSFLTGDIEICCPNMDGKVFYWSKGTIGVLVEGSSKLSEAFEQTLSLTDEEWLEVFTKQNADKFWTFNLFVKNRPGKIEEIYVDEYWDEEDVPISLASSTEKTGETYRQQTQSGSEIRLDDEQLCFINKIDGQKTVKELLKSMPLKYKVRHANQPKSQVISYYLSACSLYERCGLIKKKITE